VAADEAAAAGNQNVYVSRTHSDPCHFRVNRPPPRVPTTNPAKA